ncbi:hypothetical protein SDC9_149106 [bioreactor metagenome]|uniref:Uncharacterized protein n=1 Tax=bioreactor metagenome TaxID=1076179 RepID=A0A645EMY0_9ZZZZ
MIVMFYLLHDILGIMFNYNNLGTIYKNTVILSKFICAKYRSISQTGINTAAGWEPVKCTFKYLTMNIRRNNNVLIHIKLVKPILGLNSIESNPISDFRNI